LRLDHYVGAFCGFEEGAEHELAGDLAAPLFHSTLKRSQLAGLKWLFTDLPATGGKDPWLGY
jgi:hypothetical protein